MISGRPRVITKIYQVGKTVLSLAFQVLRPQAIAEIISGTVNPSAKMSLIFPYGVNRLVPHNHKSSEIILAHEIENR